MLADSQQSITLNAQLVAAEARRAERSPHPDSMDLYFQGLALLWQIIRGTGLNEAADAAVNERSL